MIDWQSLDLSNAANALLALITASILALAVKIGRNNPKRAESSTTTETQIHGAAIVDSATVRSISEAIREHAAAHVSESAAARNEAKDARKLGWEMLEAVERFTQEIRELRSEIRQLGDKLRR